MFEYTIRLRALQFYLLGQDVVYAVSRGKIKTPKSIMLPYTIKSLTNCTELIDICNKLGHGVSRSILEELATENAFLVLGQQQEMMALETTHPEVYRDFQKGQFAVQLSSNNPFGRTEADKTIETTINNTRGHNKLQHKPK